MDRCAYADYGTTMVRTVQQHIRRHGVGRAIYTQLIKVLARVFGLKILRALHVEHPRDDLLDCPAGYAAGFLAPAELRRYAGQQASQLSREFLDEAVARGDECYAFRDGEQLAAYGWYAFGATPIGLGNLVLKVSPEYVYMYKGFTDKRYRGQRLHAIGKTRALAHYRRKRFKGLVSYVEADNIDSLKSARRMGASRFGSVYIARIFGRHFAFCSPGCRRCNFRVERAAPGAAPSATAKSGAG